MSYSAAVWASVGIVGFLLCLKVLYVLMDATFNWWWLVLVLIFVTLAIQSLAFSIMLLTGA